MAFQYDINSIFSELEKQVAQRNKQHNEVYESKENNPIESPKDAPKTQEVAPATSKSTEDKHGGDEASKEIKDSPNSVDGGENSEKENKSKKNKNAGENTKESEGEKKEKKDSKEIKDSQKKDNEKEDEDYFITGDGRNPRKSKPKTTPEDLQIAVELLFEARKEKIEDFKKQNKQEYLKKYILEIIKEISTQHAGIDKQNGCETYDKKQIIQHIMKHQGYKILGDKYDLRDARNVQFFIDTSGVYGGANRMLNELIPEVISILEKQGYECYIAACGNGFYKRDMVEDEFYKTRKTLESYKAGKVCKIACPTAETAAKMANEAEFSIIFSDFDALTSICEMASYCQKDKVPYFLCTEDRYPWEKPKLHSWVDPDEPYEYDSNRVFDVSINGNPTLEEYENMQDDDYYEYDDDDYDDDYEYDD